MSLMRSPAQMSRGLYIEDGPRRGPVPAHHLDHAIERAVLRRDVKLPVPELIDLSIIGARLPALRRRFEFQIFGGQLIRIWVVRTIGLGGSPLSLAKSGGPHRRCLKRPVLACPPRRGSEGYATRRHCSTMDSSWTRYGRRAPSIPCRESYMKV